MKINKGPRIRDLQIQIIILDCDKTLISAEFFCLLAFEVN